MMLDIEVNYSGYVLKAVDFYNSLNVFIKYLHLATSVNNYILQINMQPKVWPTKALQPILDLFTVQINPVLVLLTTLNNIIRFCFYIMIQNFCL